MYQIFQYLYVCSVFKMHSFSHKKKKTRSSSHLKFPFHTQFVLLAIMVVNIKLSKYSLWMFTAGLSGSPVQLVVSLCISSLPIYCSSLIPVTLSLSLLERFQPFYFVCYIALTPPPNPFCCNPSKLRICKTWKGFYSPPFSWFTEPALAIT